MLVNLTDVFTSEGKVVEKTIPVDITEFQCREGNIPILKKSDLQLTMSNLGVGKALIEGKMELTLDMECNRCLQSVPVKLTIDFSRDLIASDTRKEDDDDENQDIMEGNQINIETLISNEILISLPDKVLCKPDCKGICKQCGANLNEGDCGCDDFVPDPRMAAIKDIFNAKREV